MSLKIIRNDITKMNTEAIVNTANEKPMVGAGCDTAVYNAAGYDELLNYRKENIGTVKEGDVFITPGFNLSAKYIIHAVSPRFTTEDETEKLVRDCYRKSLELAKKNNIKSIAFPLIATGSYGFPKEAGLRAALDEINKFLLKEDMEVYIVAFDPESTTLSTKISARLEEYIDENYVDEKIDEEYSRGLRSNVLYVESSRCMLDEEAAEDHIRDRRFFGDLGSSSRIDSTKPKGGREKTAKKEFNPIKIGRKANESEPFLAEEEVCEEKRRPHLAEPGSKPSKKDKLVEASLAEEAFIDEYGLTPAATKALQERLAHLSDTFSQYLMFLVKEKGLKAPEVYNGACVDKRTYSKIKKNIHYHPDKKTALCLCIGARLNIDQTKDLLGKAGYALSNSDMTDVIFQFFIENEIYSIVDLDIILEEHGLPCFIA